MALLFQEIKDGIQLGKDLDKCKSCEQKSKAKRETLPEGLLRNKEVFVLNINGLRHCYCMDCFSTLLGKYTLTDTTSNNTITEEIVAEETVVTKEEKADDNKKAKAAKPSKGK